MTSIILNRVWFVQWEERERGFDFRLLFRKGAVEITLFLASKGSARYSEIKRQEYVVGDRSLSRILKELQKRGLITRRVLSTFPISTEYSLTEKGEAVAKLLNELKSLLEEG